MREFIRPLMCKLLRVTSNTVCFYPKQKIQRNLLQKKKTVRGTGATSAWPPMAWYSCLVQQISRSVKVWRVISIGYPELLTQKLPICSRHRNKSFFLQILLSKRIYIFYKNTFHNLQKCFINLFISFIAGNLKLRCIVNL